LTSSYRNAAPLHSSGRHCTEAIPCPLRLFFCSFRLHLFLYILYFLLGIGAFISYLYSNVITAFYYIIFFLITPFWIEPRDYGETTG
jgi:hypothetical protein